MSRRTYDQYCGLARALDIVGERWTLLIVRELMSGPKRYSDLAAALTGIGTSLLANRVKQLQLDGIVERRILPPPIASTIYRLTPSGRELADAVVPLALWGARHHMREERAPSEGFRAAWALGFLARRLSPEALDGIDTTYAFHVDDDVVVLRVQDRTATLHEVHETDAETDEVPIDATLSLDSSTLAAIAGGHLSISDAVSQGGVRADGAPSALEHLLELLETALAGIVLTRRGGGDPAPARA